jgi:hypothetical protein
MPDDTREGTEDAKEEDIDQSDADYNVPPVIGKNLWYIKIEPEQESDDHCGIYASQVNQENNPAWEEA